MSPSAEILEEESADTHPPLAQTIEVPDLCRHPQSPGVHG